MNTKTTISISEARKRIFDIAEEVQMPGNYYTFTENGRPKAVLMSAEEFESWAETLEVASEFPDLKKDISRTDKAVKSGEHKKWMTLDDLMAKHGFAVADDGKKKYVVDNKAGNKRAKKI